VSGLYQDTPNSKTTGLPTHPSDGFFHTFNKSSNDPTLPAILSQQARVPTSSNLPTDTPQGKSTNTPLTVAKHSESHLDNAVRDQSDSDSTPDKHEDLIWILGRKHLSYQPPEPALPMAVAQFFSTLIRSGVLPPSDNQLFSSSTSTKRDLITNWSPAFYEDFTSRIWLTCRSQFTPIGDTTLAALSYDPNHPPCGPPPSPPSRKWFGFAEKGWTSDAGWGGMLRTSQSLLANTLLHLRLGRGKFVLLGF
jgi:cysteine protease ATG4